MTEKISITGNIIKYDESTLDLDIEEILKNRFSHHELNKNIDDLYDPYLLRDMDKAVERIIKAKDGGQRVIIFGDYDVDGVTSTAILMHFFKKINMQVSYRLPTRNDGYGLKNYFIDELSAIGVDLVITVDCGIKDKEVISYAKSLGIDVIVTDHHHVPVDLPTDAVAIINPKRLDCDYPFKEIAGVGVAFKLIMALAKKYFSDIEYVKYITETIDIVAIGTVADCMPLVDENRIIVTEGLKQIKKSRSNGIRKLIEDKIHTDLDADIFGFLIGPRLNAAGRLDTPYKAVNLILNNGDKIDEVIEDIENLNTKRKELTQTFFEDALEKIDINNNILFYESEKIENGIIGIIAGKLTEKYFKPSIVLSKNKDFMVASCRSPAYFSIGDYLEKYKDYFLHFGGHNSAAGFSIPNEKFELFKEQILADVNKLDFSKYNKELFVDKIISPYDFGFSILDKINKYKPFGMGNHKPLFMFKDFEVDKIEYLGNGIDHITIKNKFSISILGFGFGKYYDILKQNKKIDIVFDFMEDIWQGKRQLKAKIIDIIV